MEAATLALEAEATSRVEEDISPAALVSGGIRSAGCVQDRA